MAVFQNIHVNGTLRDNVVDMNSLLLAISATSCNCLDYCRVVLILRFGQERRDEQHMICVDQIPSLC